MKMKYRLSQKQEQEEDVILVPKKKHESIFKQKMNDNFKPEVSSSAGDLTIIEAKRPENMEQILLDQQAAELKYKERIDETNQLYSGLTP